MGHAPSAPVAGTAAGSGEIAGGKSHHHVIHRPGTKRKPDFLFALGVRGLTAFMAIMTKVATPPAHAPAAADAEFYLPADAFFAPTRPPRQQN